MSKEQEDSSSLKEISFASSKEISFASLKDTEKETPLLSKREEGKKIFFHEQDQNNCWA